MKLFKFENYKDFVRAYVKSLPQGGRGEFQRIAAQLRVHSTMVSQIFRGSKDLSPEQAVALCEYLALNELETSYFLGLVQLERAGSEKLKAVIRKQLAVLRDEGLKVKSLVKTDAELDEAQRATFYSAWYFSAIWLLTDIDGFQDVDSIGRRLDLPKNVVRRVMDFLLSTGLCVEKDGKYRPGATRLHLQGGPFEVPDLVHWRLKAIEKFPKRQPEAVRFSNAVTISEKDVATIRELIVALIEKFHAVVKPSKAEKLYCINVDWFEL